MSEFDWEKQKRIMERNRRISERDRRRRECSSHPKPWVQIAFGLGLVAVMVLALCIGKANAMNHGFNPDLPATKWFEGLKQPDAVNISCCGKGDAYPVDRYVRNADNSFTVWIEDGSEITYPDGAHRPFFDKSIPIHVPANKINDMQDDLDNPTEHGWIFMRVSSDTDWGTIYCFIRHPQGN
jgi:hypothetical protein